MKHVAAYIRVSSTDQNDNLQRDAIEAWRVTKKIDPAQIVYYADKFTGTTLNRPSWLKLMGNVEAGKVSEIVVWKLDRLGRQVIGLANLFADLERRGVGLTSITEAMDSTSSHGRFVRNILISVAEYEREVRRERQAAGIEAARKRNDGKCGWGGNRHKPLDIDKDRLVNLLRTDLTYAEIARILNLSHSTVYRAVRDLGGKKRFKQK